MKQATSAMRSLARKLFVLEAGDYHNSDELAAAAERAFDKLHRQLDRSMGSSTVHAFLARAVHLSRAKFPFLRAVGVDVMAEGGLTGLRESVQGRDRPEVSDGLTAVLANFIWLLSTYIGEEMAVRLVTDVLPEIAPTEGSSGLEEAR